MKRNALSLMVTLAALTTPAAFGMKYAAPTVVSIVPPATNLLLHPPVNNFSGCSSESNTIAVGYEVYAGGFRMLCADAGRIGFWTTPVEATLVGQAPDAGQRFLCPSGTALAALQFIEGLAFPFPLCGELIPNLKSGTVQRSVLYAVDGTVVEKLSKTGDIPGVVSCGPAGYVQSLQASRNAAGQVTGFGGVCNTIQTDPANIEDVNVDLAVKTVGQTAVLGRDGSQTFTVDIFNLGNAAVPASNITLDMLFDGLAWQLMPLNMPCTDILAHKGIADVVVVGKRCTISGTVAEKGGAISTAFLLEPLGSDATRPATSTPKPIVTAKVSLINENLEGADPNPSNDMAAFPVVLK
jgi:hypothetical protein